MTGRRRRVDASVVLIISAVLSCSPQGNAKGTESDKPTSPKPSKKVAAPPPTVRSVAPVNGWTAFRGNPAHTGRSSVKGPRTPKLKWVFRTGGRIYADAAVAPDGTVYVASHDHHIFAVGQDGREKWSYDTGGKIWTSPAIAKDGTIYVGSDEDRLISLDSTGLERWIFSTKQSTKKRDKPEAGRFDVDTSPLLLADGTVVFGSYLYLYAVMPSGVLRWHFKAGVGKAKIFSSPALGPDGTIYFGTQGQYFFALNQSAKVLWNIKTGGDNDSAPAVGDDGTVFFASDDGKVRSAAAGGNLKWEADLGAPIRAPLAIGHDGTVFASTYGPKPFLAALDGKNGSEKWRYHIEPGEGSYYGIQSGVLIDADGYIYFGGRDHYIYCLSPEGARVWRYKTGDQVDSGPVLGPDGTLYVGSDDSRMYAFAADF